MCVHMNTCWVGIEGGMDEPSETIIKGQCYNVVTDGHLLMWMSSVTRNTLSHAAF